MGRLVPAVTRALDVLELFLHGDGTLSAPEVTRKLQLPRTTVHELLTTLAARSYLVAVPDRPGRYRLGVRTYQLGSRYAEQLDLAAEGRQVAQRVAETCGETVHVAILEGTDVIYIAQVDSTHAVRMVSAAGRKLPAHCTSVGKMLLASLPAPELDTRLDGLELTGMTPDSITDEQELRTALDAVRERGVAVEHQESDPYVGCVAAPVRDRSGRVVAALSVSVPMIRWNEERERELAGLAVEGAEELSGRLGHHR
ncbi:IclR family transcriptional regulator [Streptomyces sp. A0958]|uniref:IclR family transcriptional regulator n=1 Tax=Streptomyces sp. A0958 TaxID=2563101 RepID=UPI00109E9C16|nr:IclR family transcriptional regulator [Streptomyces sp. A0958]THA67052.1 IclR family transcriptional regulator [Streptomyces sp. A0958]